MRKKIKVGLINFGCPKNTVDSEIMLGELVKKGYDITLDEDRADIILVNTCAFIHDAEKESVKTLASLAESGKKFIIAGCLAQKYKKELLEALPEAFAIIGTADIKSVGEALESFKAGDEVFYKVANKPVYPDVEDIERLQITVGSSSYVKIAEGCNYKCGYCIIPQLKGRYKSRKIKSIVEEARKLGQKGVSEIILIAQDTTNYGIDIYKKPCLDKLLAELNKIEEIDWIRCMYAYPSTLTDEVIDAFASLDKVVKYIDIPLQHSHPDILKAMNRPVMDYTALISKIRAKIPDVAIRTAFIVGYPGETNLHFEHLCNFVKENKFDKVGVFEYSKEKNTVGYSLPHQIPAKIKASRRKKLMQIQQKISKEINKSFIGKTIPVLIETITSKGEIIGRSYRDAPEIDGLVYIETDMLVAPGDVVMVKVFDVNEYDLFAYTI